MRYLNLEDRKKIEELYAAKYAVYQIAEFMEVHISTIYRELSRGAYEEENNIIGYSAEKGQQTFELSLKKRGRKNEKI